MPTVLEAFKALGKGRISPTVDLIKGGAAWCSGQVRGFASILRTYITNSRPKLCDYGIAPFVVSYRCRMSEVEPSAKMTTPGF